MNIADFLDQAGVATNTERPGWLRLMCPWCGPIGKHSDGLYLGIRVEGTAAFCWRCGPVSLAKTIAEITKRSEKEIWPLIKKARQQVVVPIIKRRGKLKLPKNGPLLACHRKYLKSRGFDPGQLEALWGIRGIGQHSRYGWRILIPAKLDGEAVSFTTRSIDPNDPARYLTARPEEESYPIKKLLGGEEYVRGSTIVTEGPLKMMAVGPGATCTFGINVTSHQLLRLCKIGKRIFCFDVETKAQEMAKKWCRQLAAFPGETLNVVLETADEVDEAKRSEIKKLRRILED